MDEPDPADPARPAPPPTLGDVWARVLSVDRRRLGAVVATLLLLAGLAVGGDALLRTPPAPPVEAALPFAGGSSPAASGPSASTSTTAPTEVVVHAAGAVAVPGLHAVPGGSRVADVLAAAGGPAPDADLDRVNLAAPVADGERVWFPRIGEGAPPEAVGAAGGGGGGGAAGSASRSGPVDLNTATAEELDALPGVGPAIAAAILEHRERSGPFGAVEDLLDVPGIGEAKLAQLRDLVRV